MKIEDIECFISVAETLNFRSAADQLFLSQPTLTRRIADMERELGTMLFERTTRYVKLTSSGERCLEHARRMLREYRWMQQRAREEKELMYGFLSVGAYGKGAIPILSAALNKIKGLHPYVQIQLSYENVVTLRSGIENGTFDVLLLLRSALDDLEGLQTQTVTRETPSAVLPQNHPLADHKVLTMNDIREEKLLMHSIKKSPHIFAGLQKLCFDAGFTPNIVGTSDSTIEMMVAAGMGVGLLPTMVTEPYGAPPGTVRIPLDVQTDAFDRVLAWRKQDTNPCIALFAQALRDYSKK